MSVFRVHKTKDFTVLSNHHLKDKDLSLQAKGLLSVMLSLPDDWKYSIGGLAAISKEGEKAIKSTLDELKERGYLVVTKHPPKSGAGYFTYQYDVFERPVSEKPQVSQAYPSVGLQQEGLHAEGLQQEGLPSGTLLNTNKQKTNESNTYKEELTSSKASLSESFESDLKAIVDHLNEKVGSRYTTKNKQLRGYVRARLDEGFTVSDFFTVIDTKVAKWGNDKKMRDFLRPSTLFAPSHFEEYLNESPQPKSQLDEIDWSMYELSEWTPDK